MSEPQFIHLHVHSAYSLAEGAIRVKDLVKTCVKQYMPAVAITDSNNMFGAMEFSLEASKSGVQPIVGTKLTLSCGSKLVLLAQNETGYRNLCRMLSDAFMEMDAAEGANMPLSRIKDYAQGVICLTGGPDGPLDRALVQGQTDQAKEICQTLLEAFTNRLYIEVQRHDTPQEHQVEPQLIDLAYELNIPLVATNAAYFMERKAHEAHDALLCIAEGRYVSETDRRKVTPEHYLKSEKEMVELFSDLPEALQNSVLIAKRCAYFVKPIDPILPAFDTEEGRSEFEELKAQAEQGLRWRLDNFVKTDDEQVYHDRLTYELDIINSMGFPGYFLIVSDFIKWSKEQNIPVGPGRGSGAGSLVAWSLKITDLDPIALGLLFERFLNPERVSMPDFDIDFCQERRDEVIKYVQDKYGQDRVAQIITFGKLQARAVVRDVGRVLQMPYMQVDRIAKLIPNNPANPVTLAEALEQDADLRRERDKDEVQSKLIAIALQLEGLYRHASTHAAGLVIGDRPLHELVPLYRDPRSDMPVTQFNMKYVEQAGLVKFDFLGLKTMTVIQKAVDMVNRNRGADDAIELLKIPLDDKKSYNLMARGQTVGVFQLESAGMRDTLRRVKPNRFEDIIALVSLYRPGPMDNIPKYAAIKDGKEEPDYMHPKLQPYLEETYGIMIYQEQVMQAAQALAGYTLGGADLLRRAMGKKIVEEMDAQREMFVTGAAKHNDVPKDQSSSIFDQIAKFAGYGFNKSHAAAYALIAYWTAWLKANHPLEFMAASMTLDLGNTDKLAVFKQDLDRMKVPLRQPDVNYSDAFFKVEGKGVRYALAALKGVGEQAMISLVQERVTNGAFASLEDFAKRIDPKGLNKRQFEQLACAGGFNSLNENRAQMAASAEIVLRYAQSLAEEKASGQVSLFGDAEEGGGLGLPQLPQVGTWDALETLAKEFAAIGFYLSAHPLDSRAQQFANLKIASIADVEAALQDIPAKRFQMAGVLLKKQEKMSQKGSKYAFLQLSDPSGVYEVMMFSEVLAMSRSFLEPGNFLLLSVDAEQKEDQVRMLINNVQPLEDALESRIQKIELDVEHGAKLEKLKQFLDIEGKGNAKIIINLDLEDLGVAQYALPGRWKLSPQARNILREEKGYLAVREA